MSNPMPGSYSASGVPFRLPLLHLVRHPALSRSSQVWPKEAAVPGLGEESLLSAQSSEYPSFPSKLGNPSSELHAWFRSCLLRSED